MSSTRYDPRKSSTPQSIPLQDLSRPPDSGDIVDGGQPHRRSRSLLERSHLLSGGRTSGQVYERLAENSPAPGGRYALQSTSSTTQSPNTESRRPPYNDETLSPVAAEDHAAFQAAMGSVGLSFDTLEPRRSRGSSMTTPSAAAHSLGIITEGEGLPPFSHHRRARTTESESYFSPTDSDTTPLTDRAHLQPISGALSSSTPSIPRDRRSFQSIRFTDGASPGPRLGDDLLTAEAGLIRSGSILGGSPSNRSRQRSLSPSVTGASPLSRAGSVVRKMSQRVVNLSNEPEIVEQSIRRKSSIKQARLEGPPSFPAMTEYAHDEPVRSPSPTEKNLKARFVPGAPGTWQQRTNPLRGKTLGLFAPENRLRVNLCEMLVHPVTEPVILVLIVFQTILLAIDSAPSHVPRSKAWGTSWIDYALFVLFIIYTLEIIARIIVSGLWFNPQDYSTINRSMGFKNAIIEQGRRLFTSPRQSINKPTPSSMEPQQPSILRSFTSMQGERDQPGNTRQQQRVRLARRAFLRHSFNRLDFLAVVSYWISFGLSMAHIQSERHFYVFQMLSCLRILRLLSLTSGTSVFESIILLLCPATDQKYQVILRSLKKAAPLLVNVAFLIGFFWLLFAIIAVQNFKSSFRRTCVWLDPANAKNYTQNLAPDNVQFCGGYLNATTGEAWPWLYADGSNGTDASKGYLCPRGSLCVEGKNPYNGTVSFDNVLQSLELIFVIMSSNTFSDLLYYTADSDYLAAALFFAAGIVILSLWLMNLLVAVITSSFQVIREESKTSAFTAKEEALPMEDEMRPTRPGTLKRLYDRTYWVWIMIIIFDLLIQCLRSTEMESTREIFINTTETIVTFILLLEIIMRFISDWRNFHRSKRNWLDLALAVITTVMQMPRIRNSGQPYAWMTIFQILRFYRVVMAVSLTRDLLMLVFRNVTGLLNLIVFVFLISFLTAIFAVQIFRGEIPVTDPISDSPIRITFSDIYNAFVGMYQVLSSENWTALMYNVTQYDVGWNTAWIGAAFFILWFILANFIVLNMFIAVIQESFDVTEDEKRLQQVKAFLQQKDLGGSSHGNLSLSTILKLGRGMGKRRDPLDYGPASMEMLLKDAVVRDFLDEQPEHHDTAHIHAQASGTDQAMGQVQPGVLSAIWGTITSFAKNREPNPFYSRLQFSRAYEDLDPRTMAKEVVSATEQRKRAQRRYLQTHPSYNVSLFLFRPSNPIRLFCQHIVGPGRGSQRIEGVDPIKPLWYAFSAFIYAAIVAMVLLACVTTPLYQREYFQTHTYSVRNWFVWSDMSFAILFSIEAVIKVIADGFFWTPNAYFRGSWGFIDGLVLITLWINVVTSLFQDGGISRAVGAFKALRALRLLNVSDSARDTFHSVIILGGWKVLSAAFVSLSLLFPFAIYGLNLFNGQMESCNDTTPTISSLSDCVGEYMNSLYAWNVLAPRQVANPYYNFDSFGGSLFILFQIVSQEGWTDVMWSAQSITGRGQQPQPFASQGNALFFIAFNLLAAVFVLTLFVSVFIRNYTEQTGVAFLTAEQRSWLELRKLLRQISPSKRPINKPNQKWRNWCYRIAVKKHGRWQRGVTVTLVFHLILLMLEFYPEVVWWDRTRDFIFLVFTLIYIMNVMIRLVGLTWKRFRRSSWDLYSILAVGGTFITTVAALSKANDRIYTRVHKLFLVSIALLLIPRNNQLDQLFKTAAASLTVIGNLLATWFVLFLVYAIALTQTFGLTKFGSTETSNLNFRTVPKALILLFRMSCGEGWNQIMEDFATMTSPKCVVSDDFFNSDCGSASWARALFISWNILSMYIFVSLFVSLIFESFSYVYQQSSGLSAVSREEIRRFKQAWATFDPEGTGFISKEAFPRLLGELSGVFEMRIYDGEHSVRRILEDCTVTRRNSDPSSAVVDGVDLGKLAKRLETIPVQEIRRRRARMNIFYEEILVSADLDRGISFTSCLMILAHYNVISDNKSLRLEEFLRRRARLQRVEEAVRRNIVIGFFDTMYWSRRFRQTVDARRRARMTAVPQFAVPEIFVDDPDDITMAHEPGGHSPLSSSMDMPGGSPARGMSLGASGFGPRFVTPDFPAGSRRDSRGSSPATSHHSDISPHLSPHTQSFSDGGRGYDLSLGPSSSPVDGAGDGHSRSRQNSNVSAQDVLEVLDNSAWGESIRRSFTMRRPSNRSPRGGGSGSG